MYMLCVLSTLLAYQKYTKCTASMTGLLFRSFCDRG